MSKTDIKIWQRHLKQELVYAGLIDGDFGPGTRRASFELISVEEPVKKPPSSKTATLIYINQSATRNGKITKNLEKNLIEAVTTVYGSDHSIKIYSGGQDRKGHGKRRTGSIRHDDLGSGGRAADLYVYGPDGQKIKGLKLAKLGQYWLAKDFGSCGTEMAVGGIHLDEWKKSDLKKGMGSNWTYPYSNKKSWGAKAKKILQNGEDGKMPKL